MWGKGQVRKAEGSKRMIKTILSILFCVVLMNGCIKQEKPVVDEEDEGNILIGFSMGTLLEDRWLQDRDIFMALAQTEGMEVTVANANKDSDVQYDQVKEMIEMGIDVLVIAPNNSNTEARCVKAAKEKGIPVISYDRLIYKSNVDAYISFDNEYIGKLMGRYALEQIPEGNYIIVNGAVDDSNSVLLDKGYKNVLNSSIINGKIKILAETNVDGWDPDEARDYVSQQLRTIYSTEQKVDAIICGNDSLAKAAINALSETNVTNDVVVIGQDADLDACQYLVNGKQSMTIYKPIRNLVARTVEACVTLAKGEKVESGKTFNDDSYQVPYINVDVIEVTKDNLDETVINDGFHLKEDIYGSSD